VFSRISGKILPLLQLTRMALVFTAIADGSASFLILHRGEGAAEPWGQLVWVIIIAIGLYGFGMSLNDIIDRRRDGMIAPHRPLPSARLGVTTAHLICGGVFTMAIAAAAFYASLTGVWMSLGLALWTAALIYLYDVAGKYLVALGILSLGLIRFFHCLIAAPQIPVLWHPLLILNHVTILSAVAYQLETKRPALTRAHWWTALGGLLMIDAITIFIIGSRRAMDVGSWHSALHITPWLLLPMAAAVAFGVVAWLIYHRSATPRSGGQAMMLYGLLWLIIYDAAFVGAYVGWVAALCIFLLLPIAYFSVQLMRWWSAVVSLARRPTYKRAETG
jgi:4-hydroxybenzoate polyprenyltransferase